MMSNQHKQKGFTLIELLIVVAILGVIFAALTPYLEKFSTLKNIANDERDQYRNMLVGQSLMEVAERTDGRLPAMETGNNIPLLAAGPGNTETEIFLEALWSRGLHEGIAATDGTQAENPRLYRVVQDTLEVPIFGNSGDRVIMEMDYAAVYLPFDGLGLNFNPRTLDIEDARDAKAFIFSNRKFQDAKLRATSSRLDRIRRAINNHLTMRRLQAPPNQLLTANFLPGSTPGGTGALNCGHPWQRLSTSTALEEIGLDSKEFEETAWGAPIFYCRNYGNNSAAPYFGGLAIAKDVNDSANTLSTNHVVISL